MAFFSDLTTSLKQRWLQFFQVNRSWIMRHMEVQSVYTPDGGKRPPSYFILGVANALEPQLAELMVPFSKLNPDVEALIDALELNFDPDLVLGNRFHTAANPEEPRDESSDMSDEEVAPMVQEPIYNVTVVETLTEIEPDQLNGMSLDDTVDQVVLVQSDDDESIVVLNVAEPDTLITMSPDDIVDQVVLVESDDDESIVVMNVDELDELSNMLLDDTESEVDLVESDDGFPETPSAAEPDTFGDMSLDEMADFTVPLESSDDESLKTPSAAQSDQADDVLSDIWGEETLADSEQADKKQSKHDQEISRLFPNF